MYFSIIGTPCGFSIRIGLFSSDVYGADARTEPNRHPFVWRLCNWSWNDSELYLHLKNHLISCQYTISIIDSISIANYKGILNSWPCIRYAITTSDEYLYIHFRLLISIAGCERLLYIFGESARSWKLCRYHDPGWEFYAAKIETNLLSIRISKHFKAFKQFFCYWTLNSRSDGPFTCIWISGWYSGTKRARFCIVLVGEVPTENQ